MTAPACYHAAEPMSPVDRSVNIADLRRLARRRAHPMVFDYIDGGADDERTLAANVGDFDSLPLAHRVLVDVSAIDTRTSLLNHQLAFPFLFAPAAGNRLFHPEGERAVANVAAEFEIPYALSTLSTVSMEDVAAIGPMRWFQLYVWRDRGLLREMIARARDSGYTALILTADFAIAGHRERDLRRGFTVPPRIGLQQVMNAALHPAWTWGYLRSSEITYANLNATVSATSLTDFVARQLSASFTWRDAEWLLAQWGGVAILKGVVHPDDAETARSVGFRGLMISNHGGRQLDGSISPIRALPAIRDNVGRSLDLILDGGIRRGTHILKALALGADAVSFARPYLYGLAAGGVRGVRRAAELMALSLRRDMALAGTPSIGAVDGRILLPGGLPTSAV